MSTSDNLAIQGEAGDSLSRGNVTSKVLNGLNVLQVMRQRLLLAEEQELGPDESRGMATMLATVMEEIGSAILEETA